LSDLRRAKTAWEQRIEHMLTRPGMFSASPEALEDSFRTALEAWETMDRAGGKKSGRSALTFVWKHVLKDAYQEEDAHFDGQVARFSQLAPGSHDSLRMAEWLRRVWERLRDPIERLAALSEED
jgi:hypothetical protein